MCWRLLLWADCLTYFFKFYGTYGVAQRHNAQNVLKLKNKHHIFYIVKNKINRLLSEYTGLNLYRGFKSLPLRH